MLKLQQLFSITLQFAIFRSPLKQVLLLCKHGDFCVVFVERKDAYARCLQINVFEYRICLGD
jgi:hypothetical protein